MTKRFERGLPLLEIQTTIRLDHIAYLPDKLGNRWPSRHEIKSVRNIKLYYFEKRQEPECITKTSANIFLVCMS